MTEYVECPIRGGHRRHNGPCPLMDIQAMIACPDCKHPWHTDQRPTCPNCGLDWEDVKAAAAFVVARRSA